MKPLLFSLLIALALCACNDKRSAQTPITTPANPPPASTYAADNSGHNATNTNAAPTALNQSEKPDDIEITRQIRQAIVADSTMSTNAKNCKIITMNGMVTLRGPVANAQERLAIGISASKIAGENKVDNLLEYSN